MTASMTPGPQPPGEEGDVPLSAARGRTMKMMALGLMIVLTHRGGGGGKLAMPNDSGCLPRAEGLGEEGGEGVERVVGHGKGAVEERTWMATVTATG